MTLFTPEAQAIVDGAEPLRVDTLWLSLLESSFGSRLLAAWGLTLDDVQALQPNLEQEDAAAILRFAGLMTGMTSAGTECSEYVIGNLLHDAESSLSRGVPGIMGALQSYP